MFILDFRSICLYVQAANLEAFMISPWNGQTVWEFHMVPFWILCCFCFEERSTIISVIVEIVSVVQEWFRTHSIQLNLTKTNLVYFGNALLPEVGMNCEVFAFTGYPRRPTRLRSAFSFIKNSYSNSLQKYFYFSSTGLDTSFRKVEDY